MQKGKQMRTIVAAMANNRVIGNNGKLPWYLPKDWEHFREVTNGGTFLMGRKSYEADDRLLSEKWNYILTSNNNINLCDHCSIVGSLNEFYSLTYNEEEVFILGGGNVFSEALKDESINKMILTFVDASPEGDTYFPKVNWSRWKEVKSLSFDRDEFHKHSFTIKTFVRMIE